MSICASTFTTVQALYASYKFDLSLCFLVHLGFNFFIIIFFLLLFFKYLSVLISTLKSGTCYRTASAQHSQNSIPDVGKIWHSALVPERWEISPFSFNELTTTASPNQLVYYCIQSQLKQSSRGYWLLNKFSFLSELNLIQSPQKLWSTIIFLQKESKL